MLYPQGVNSFVDPHTGFEQPLDQSPLFLTRAGGSPAPLAAPTPFRPQGTPALPGGCGPSPNGAAKRWATLAFSERNGQKAALLWVQGCSSSKEKQKHQSRPRSAEASTSCFKLGTLRRPRGTRLILSGNLRGGCNDGTLAVNHQEIAVCDLGRGSIHADEDVYPVVILPERTDLRSQ